jgi:hypothetical protein
MFYSSGDCIPSSARTSDLGLTEFQAFPDVRPSGCMHGLDARQTAPILTLCLQPAGRNGCAFPFRSAYVVGVVATGMLRSFSNRESRLGPTIQDPAVAGGEALKPFAYVIDDEAAICQIVSATLNGLGIESESFIGSERRRGGCCAVPRDRAVAAAAAR